ncbi:alpha/beta hydrolase [Mesorhizobium sp. WSM3860]|uniref:alpha/beta fold hydrolase n=1 Tax=Mesorhizobium sp. WSM3860 TaxID=2029403 RepID=UPI000BB07458|nr:alpha/beta hydrolase [Mesorhizobium sp. WSM3860]PBC03697.1 alpha/beta hydrolase [Mesorhizobium sp. WSM3860]
MTGRNFPTRIVRTRDLHLAYEEHGSAEGPVIVLLHGFPYDPRCFDHTVGPLSERGYRIIVPYLRGYGPTRFVSDESMRTGQQASLGRDLLDLLDELAIPSAALVGYDWGARAACIVAALWPHRVRCLVTGGGYSIQDISGSATPQSPDAEYRYWYQYYFHTARGKAGLAANRNDICSLLWKLWSPLWPFDKEVFAQTAASFENPDFVDVVIHSYRHRFGYAPGDPALEELERRLAERPAIIVPTISLCGGADGVVPASEIDNEAQYFKGAYERRVLPRIGHNIPLEAPEMVINAVLDLH